MARTTKKTSNQEPLEKTLWKSADKLRKNMDAAEYKHVVLGLIFLKYISDAFEELHAKLEAGEGEYEGRREATHEHTIIGRGPTELLIVNDHPSRPTRPVHWPRSAGRSQRLGPQTSAPKRSARWSTGFREMTLGAWSRNSRQRRAMANQSRG